MRDHAQGEKLATKFLDSVGIAPDHANASVARNLFPRQHVAPQDPVVW